MKHNPMGLRRDGLCEAEKEVARFKKEKQVTPNHDALFLLLSGVCGVYLTLSFHCYTMWLLLSDLVLF